MPYRLLTCLFIALLTAFSLYGFLEIQTLRQTQKTTSEGIRQELQSQSQAIDALSQKMLIVETRTEQLGVREEETTTTIKTPFGGIGVHFQFQDADIIPEKGLLIGTSMEGKPAWRAGLRDGDIITAVDGQSVAGMKAIEAVNKIRGKVGTLVTLTYKSNQNGEEQTVSLSREHIDIKNPSAPKKDYSDVLLKWLPTHHAHRLVVTPETIATGQDVLKFALQNIGSVTAPPLKLAVGSVNQIASPDWSISAPCLKRETPAGEVCEISIRAKPKMDGQMEGYLSVIGPGGQQLSQMKIAGYASGIGGTLPLGVLGHGAPCPEAGTAFEVAVGAKNSLDGNNPTFQEPVNGKARLVTVTCPSWQREGGGTSFYSCPRSANDNQYTATVTEYESAHINGPWVSTKAREHSAFAHVACRDGVIVEIVGTWKPEK